MGGKLSRNKGATWEREVVIRFKQIYGDDNVRRVLQSQGGKVVGSDVRVTEPAGGGFEIECKHGVKPNPRAALEQCERDNPEPRTRWCLAIIKDDGKATPGKACNPFVVMRLNDFEELIAERGTSEKEETE